MYKLNHVVLYDSFFHSIMVFDLIHSNYSSFKGFVLQFLFENPNVSVQYELFKNSECKYICVRWWVELFSV